MKREIRMYGLVPYNISPIQQAIQFGHAVVEYSQEHFHDREYQEWARDWKTFIILNGGTTNMNSARMGSLNQHTFTLNENGVKFAIFNEPDLGDQLTAITFLVDERVFDKKKYPDYDKLCESIVAAGGGDFVPTYEEWLLSFSKNEEEQKRILFLREFLKNFRLA